MGAGGWRWKYPSQGCLMIPVSQSLVWNHEMEGRSCNRWGRSESAGASAKPMYRKKEGRGRGGRGKVERERAGERGSIRIRNTMTRRSVTGADRYCGILWDADAVGVTKPCVGFQKSSWKSNSPPGGQKMPLIIDLHQVPFLSAVAISQKPRDHSINLKFHSARLNHLTPRRCRCQRNTRRELEDLDRVNGIDGHAWLSRALAKNLLENAEYPRSIPR